MVTDRARALNRIVHPLAHPARKAILRRPSRRELNPSELTAPKRMSFPAASKHVRMLERAKLVRRRISGRSHRRCLNSAPLKEAAESTEGFRQA